MKPKPKSILVCLASVLMINITDAQILIKDSSNYVPTDKIALIPGGLNFIAIGDWGRVGEDHQKQVAAQMGKTSSEIKSQFTIAVGDNFYPSGVVSEFDSL